MGKEKLLDTIKRLGKVSGATDKLKDAQNAAGTSLPIYTERESQKIKMTEVPSRWPNEFLPAWNFGTIGRSTMASCGRKKLRAITVWCPPFVLIAKAAVVCWPMWTKILLKYASLKAIPRIQVHGAETALKGPATHNQIYDPERILYPLKRVGKRARASGNVFRGPSP